MGGAAGYSPGEFQRQCPTVSGSGMAYPVTSAPTATVEIFGMSGGIFWPEQVLPEVLGSPLWRARRAVKCPYGYSWTDRYKNKCSRRKYHGVQQPDYLRKVFGWFLPSSTKRPPTAWMPWGESGELPPTRPPRTRPPRQEEHGGVEGEGGGEGDQEDGRGEGGKGGGPDEPGGADEPGDDEQSSEEDRPPGGGAAPERRGPGMGRAREGAPLRAMQRKIGSADRNGRAGGDQPPGDEPTNARDGKIAAPKEGTGGGSKMSDAPVNRWQGKGRLVKAPPLEESEEESDDESDEMGAAGAKAKKKRVKKNATKRPRKKRIPSGGATKVHGGYRSMPFWLKKEPKHRQKR